MGDALAIDKVAALGEALGVGCPLGTPANCVAVSALGEALAIDETAAVGEALGVGCPPTPFEEAVAAPKS